MSSMSTIASMAVAMIAVSIGSAIAADSRCANEVKTTSRTSNYGERNRHTYTDDGENDGEFIKRAGVDDVANNSAKDNTSPNAAHIADGNAHGAPATKTDLEASVQLTPRSASSDSSPASLGNVKLKDIGDSIDEAREKFKQATDKIRSCITRLGEAMTIRKDTTLSDAARKVAKANVSLAMQDKLDAMAEQGSIKAKISELSNKYVDKLREDLSHGFAKDRPDKVQGIRQAVDEYLECLRKAHEADTVAEAAAKDQKGALHRAATKAWEDENTSAQALQKIVQTVTVHTSSEASNAPSRPASKPPKALAVPKVKDPSLPARQAATKARFIRLARDRNQAIESKVASTERPIEGVVTDSEYENFDLPRVSMTDEHEVDVSQYDEWLTRQTAIPSKSSRESTKISKLVNETLLKSWANGFDVEATVNACVKLLNLYKDAQKVHVTKCIIANIVNTALENMRGSLKVTYSCMQVIRELGDDDELLRNLFLKKMGSLSNLCIPRPLDMPWTRIEPKSLTVKEADDYITGFLLGNNFDQIDGELINFAMDSESGNKTATTVKVGSYDRLQPIIQHHLRCLQLYGAYLRSEQDEAFAFALTFLRTMRQVPLHLICVAGFLESAIYDMTRFDSDQADQVIDEIVVQWLPNAVNDSNFPTDTCESKIRGLKAQARIEPAGWIKPSSPPSTPTASALLSKNPAVPEVIKVSATRAVPASGVPAVLQVPAVPAVPRVPPSPPMPLAHAVPLAPPLVPTSTSMTG